VPTLTANANNIEWLMEKLYNARRQLEASNVTSPTFVLLTKGIDDRRKIEDAIFRWFHSKYGFDLMFRKMEPELESETLTAFGLPEINCRVVLMDI
jgi:hypothetical protein